MLVYYKDGEKRYQIAPEGIKVGDVIVTAKRAKAKLGNRMQLINILIGFEIYCVQINPSKTGQMAKSAGNSAKLVSFDGELAQVQLPSVKCALYTSSCYASVGRISKR